MEREPSERHSPSDPEWEALAGGLDDALLRSIGRLPQYRAADVDVEAALASVNARRAEESLPRQWRTHLLRAAAAIIVVLGASLIWRASDTPVVTTPQIAVVPQPRIFQTMAGQTDTLSLADGTSVVLGPGSRLTVAAEYGDQARTVELSGEALFDVRHDDSRAFTVKAGNATIRDIGTTFVVRSNPDGEVRVTVTVGSVVLHATGKAESEGVILRAGDRGLLDRRGFALAQRDRAPEADLAFTKGRMVFEDASLEEVALELRRWYDIELKIDDGALSSRHITASFKGESVDQVLNVIAQTLGVTIERHGNTAFLHAQP
jgi:transmembrane sensor